MVEATSGNTGIGLAMVCAQKGYPLVVTMADSFSIERRKLMRMLGAKVVLTPRAEKGYGMYRKAVELAEAMAGFSPASSKPRPMPTSTKGRRRARSSTTSRASGSTGSSPATERGNARRRRPVLRRERPETRIVLCEPANAQLVGSGDEQNRAPDGTPAMTHPAFEPHPIQGWTPDFIPLVLQEGIDLGFLRRNRARGRRGRGEMGQGPRPEGGNSSPAFRAARRSPWRARSPTGRPPDR